MNFEVGKITMESWQVFHAALKKLPKGVIHNIFRRSASLVSQWAANPKYCECTKRNPIDRIRLMLEEMDTAGCGEYARWSIDYMAEPIGGRFEPLNPACSDKKSVDGEVADVAVRFGTLADEIRKAMADGSLDVDEIAVIKEHARELKSEVDQLLDAVGIIGGV